MQPLIPFLAGCLFLLPQPQCRLAVHRVACAQQKSWVGERVLPTKPAKEIKFGDRVDDKQVDFPYSGWLSVKVRDQREGKLRLHDGHREGWVDKGDFILLVDAPAHFDRLVQANPKDVWALLMRGTARLEMFDTDDAIKDFDECIRLDPTNSVAFASRAQAWIDKKEPDKAFKDYDQAIRLDRKNAAAFVSRGNLWQDKKDFDKAINDYDEAIRLQPRYANAFHDRGFAWNYKRNLEKALRDYDEAIRLDSRYTLAYCNRGFVWLGKKEYDKGLKDMNEAVRLEPDFAPFVNARGTAWFCKKEFDKAIKDFDQALRLDPKYARAIYERSIVQLVTRRAGATDGFQDVLDLQGWKGDRSIYCVIFGHLAARQVGDAAAANRFLKDSKGKLDESWPYPVVQFLRGEIDEPALLRLARDNGKRTEARCFLGLDHALNGRKMEALAHFRWVVEQGDAGYVEYSVAEVELERLELPSKKLK
jgi:tetratricopeptide (TPR) repeat protein